MKLFSALTVIAIAATGPALAEGKCATGFLRLRPAIGVRAPGRNAQVSGDRLAVGSDEAIGEASAARTARLDDSGEAFAAACREVALQGVGLLGNALVEIGKNLALNRHVDESAQRQRRGSEQRQIEDGQPEAGGPK